MTSKKRNRPAAEGKSRGQQDTESALQEELHREEGEGRDLIGDMSSNQNLSGSSTWTTLSGTAEATETEPRRGGERAGHSADELPNTADNELRRVAEEIASRLRRRGIWLSSHESSEELANLLEAVERFELVVERSGGDLMMDEPVQGSAAPIAPDDAAFVLPARKKNETVDQFIGRIADAAVRAGRSRGRGS